MEGFKFLFLLILMTTAIYYFYTHPGKIGEFIGGSLKFLSKIIKTGMEYVAVPVSPENKPVANLYNSNSEKNFVRVLDSQGNIIKEVSY